MVRSLKMIEWIQSSFIEVISRLQLYTRGVEVESQLWSDTGTRGVVGSSILLLFPDVRTPPPPDADNRLCSTPRKQVAAPDAANTGPDVATKRVVHLSICYDF